MFLIEPTAYPGIAVGCTHLIKHLILRIFALHLWDNMVVFDLCSGASLLGLAPMKHMTRVPHDQSKEAQHRRYGTVYIALRYYLQLPQKVFLIGGSHEDCVPFSAVLSDDGSLHSEHAYIDTKQQVAILPYSSGTTGLPKGVMLSHFTEVANAIQAEYERFFFFVNKCLLC